MSYILYDNKPYHSSFRGHLSKTQDLLGGSFFGKPDINCYFYEIFIVKPGRNTRGVGWVSANSYFRRTYLMNNPLIPYGFTSTSRPSAPVGF